jgi:hypothetical protein
MNDQIANILVEVQAQAPEVTRQMADYGVASAIIATIGLLFPMAILGWAFFRKYNDPEERFGARIAIGVAAILIALIILAVVDNGVKALFFPKAYVAERLLLKK